MSELPALTFFLVLQLTVALSQIRQYSFIKRSSNHAHFTYSTVFVSSEKNTGVIPLAVVCASDEKCMLFSSGAKTWLRKGQPLNSYSEYRDVKTTGNRIKRERMKNNKDHFKYKPWFAWKENYIAETKCDLRTSNRLKTVSICRPDVLKYYNISRKVLYLPKKLKDISIITVQGTFKEKGWVTVHLYNPRLRYIRNFHMKLTWEALKIRESIYTYCVDIAPRLKISHPFTFSFNTAGNILKTYYSNGHSNEYHMHKKSLAAGVNKIWIETSNGNIDLYIKSCHEARFVSRGCVFQNEKGKAIKLVHLPAKLKELSMISVTGIFTRDNQYLLFSLTASKRRGRIKIALKTKRLSLSYEREKYNANLQKYPVIPGRKFVFTFNSVNGTFKFSLNTGAQGTIRTYGFLGNVDKITIDWPGCMETLDIRVEKKENGQNQKSPEITVIKYLQLKGLTPTQIHADMVSTSGDDALYFSTVKKWIPEFEHGRESLCDDTRPRKPSTTSIPDTLPWCVTFGLQCKEYS